ncbi:hypothetical protein Y032_0459g1837 [Ancylostoma ceylanicum]|uniref:Uncharacterized protein n=1 Tax=Ancylostoma ceylanicum TaxID=53326 RepID=A0A016WXX1_9BILA|nr:hypothetical protein Y032_0459g1837 [Ancylostoma ceylanicum]
MEKSRSHSYARRRNRTWLGRRVRKFTRQRFSSKRVQALGGWISKAWTHKRIRKRNQVENLLLHLTC